MSRHEADREDLMREATALCERVEMRLPGEPEPVVAGFRADGRMSLYFGPDPAFHFDSEGTLRRAYCGGDLYRSQGKTLARLRRTRDETGVTLERHDLDPVELAQFLSHMQNRLALLLAAIKAKQVDCCREIPPNGQLGARLLERLPQACLGRLAPPLKK
jgi:hypothetical protein